MSLSGSPAEVPRSPNWTRLLTRLVVILIVAFAIGAVLNRISVSLAHSTSPAGFPRGVLQGALMPMALPNLLVGRDVMIYSEHNTGVPYKLGYTSGVNGCGAIFFGFLFWRVTRWRRGARNSPAVPVKGTQACG